MRKVLIIICVLLLTVPLVAQRAGVRTGNIYGTVLDTEGNPLPGVTVTLTGFTIAPMISTSSADGSFRFLSLHPAKDYSVKAELQGFKTKIETGIIVTVGGITELEVVMDMGVLEEEITVTAVSPIVEIKKTAVTTSVNYEMLQSLPSARDPWVVLQMVPSIQVDRENIGGNESGQQASFVMKGGGGSNDVWTMDGVVITDPAAIGASPTYFDFDMFEEMQVTTGGADVETQTGGVGLNFVSRRGGNRVSLGGRFYYTDNKFQAQPSGADYDLVKEVFSEANGYPPEAGVNQIKDIKDFGFNMGGPLWKDKAWWWGSYGVQEIKTTIITGSKDETFLTNYAGKINLQIIPENRFEFFIHSGKKEKFGRSSSSADPLGWNQRGKFHFGSPIIKFQDEHMFGDDLFVSAQYGYTNSGFGMWPASDLKGEGVRWYDIQGARSYESSWWFFSGRPHKVYKINANYFNDDLLGASHEFKIGAEYVDRGNEWVSQSSGGNMRINYNYNSKTVDWDGDGDRDIVKDEFGIDLMRIQFYPTWDGGNTTRAFSVYASDTISFGRLNLKLGIRYDIQTPWSEGQVAESIYLSEDASETINWYNEASASRVMDAQAKYLESGVAQTLAGIFPRIEAPPAHDTQSWTMFSPRVGITWDVTGDGKTIAKASGAVYGSYMGTWGGYWRKQAGGQGIRFYWHDVNGNGTVSLNELYWSAYTSARTAYRAFDDAGNFQGNVAREENLMWWGYDFENPSNLLDSRYQFDPDWNTDLTYEALISLERELMPDFSVSAYFTWRRYNNWWRTARYAYESGGVLLDEEHYAQVGTVPQTFEGELPDGTPATIDMRDAGGKPWYAWAEGVKNIYDRYVTTWPKDAYDQYFGVDFVVNKRLSNKWMFQGSFTLQDQKTYYDVGISNPTNLWALSGTVYAYNIGGASGKLSQPVFSRWLLKAQGLYQLPFDINISFSFNAREGHLIDYYIDMNDENWVNPYNQTTEVRLEEFGTTRLPTFYNLNMRLEKVLRVGDIGRIYVMIDVFNFFNNNVMNRRRDYDYGTYYVADQEHSAYSRSGEPNEVLNPRVFRLGVRFQF
ncbi:hypothetical protein ES702_05245 [subsurface metagenome]